MNNHYGELYYRNLTIINKDYKKQYNQNLFLYINRFRVIGDKYSKVPCFGGRYIKISDDKKYQKRYSLNLIDVRSTSCKLIKSNLKNKEVDNFIFIYL